MKILPEVYIVIYKIKGEKLPQTTIGTHRSLAAALAANDLHFGLQEGDAIAYSTEKLWLHILLMLTPGWYHRGK